MSDREPPARDRWYVLIVLTLVYAINLADRFAVSTLIEPIGKDLGLSDTEVGVLTGVALGVFYVVLGLPMGRLADRANRTRILTAALAAWSVMTALCGLSQNYWQLFLARIGVGIGEAGGTPPSTSIIADKFSARWRPLALSVFALGAPLGSWLGTTLVGWVAERFAWRASFLALGVPGIAAALVVWLTVREPRRGQSDAGSDARPAGFLETLRYVRTQPALFHFMIGTAVLTFWSWGLLWWTPAFLGRSYGMTVGEAGETLGLMHLIGGTGATLLAAWVMTRARSASSASVMRLMTWVTLAAVGPSILLYAIDDRRLSVALLWVFVPATYFWLGPTFGVLQNLVPPGMRAQACAMFLFTTNVANLIVAPQLIGTMSDGFRVIFGTGDASLRWVLALCATSGLWAAWHLWRCSRLLPVGQEAVLGGESV